MELRSLCIALAAEASLALVPSPAAGQQDSGPADIFPTHAVLVTGYGSASYDAVFASGRTPNDFGASLNPIFLFQISDRVLFESELEFALEAGGTSTDLEYADLGFLLTRNVVVEAGKFLLPFNIFSERLHPTWINKFITHPPIYGHPGGTDATMPLLPVLSDVGVQVRGSLDVGEYGSVTAVGFVSQGPTVEAPGEHEESAGEAGAMEVPEVVFGENFTDNNENKMVGVRAGFGIAPYLEVNVSGMTAKYDDAGRLSFTGLGAHLEGRYRGLELHAEWIRTGQQVADGTDQARRATLTRNGYFTQLAYRHGRLEPALRWSQIFDGDLEGETAMPGGEQMALALSYWYEPALVIKVGYLVNLERGTDVPNNRLGIQWAFGF